MPRATIVLGGGRASRMGTDKLALTMEGRPLLERVVDAALPLSDVVIVAGRRPGRWDRDDVIFAPEDPPFGGPVAGIEAALAHVGGASEVMLLAGDLAAPESAVEMLCDLDMGPDGVVLLDEDGRLQMLLGRYRTQAIRDSLAALGEARGAPLGRLVGDLDLTRVPAPTTLVDDVDTPDDAARLGATRPKADSMTLIAAVVDTAIDTDTLYAAVDDDRAGAVVSFCGQVRNHDHGRDVTGIEYVGHPSADKVMREVVEEFAEREGVHAIAAHHRVGVLGIGDVALYVAVGASHRGQAFSCAADIVDRVKEMLPIWKKQHFVDGTHEWSQCP